MLLLDDVRDRAREVYEHALRHIGVAPGFVPVDLDEVVWSNQQSARPRELTPAERGELYEFFAADIRALSELIGRDLGMWRPK